MRGVLLGIMLAISAIPAFALEDCVVSFDGTLTDIRVEDCQILEVHPVVTVLNEKNTLIVHPLKEGCTKFSVLKNGTERVEFKVRVTEDETVTDEIEGFDVLSLDNPPEILDCDIDAPPMLREEGEDIPPALREGEE